MKNVTLSEGLEIISDLAFAQCYQLKSINIPSTIQYIDNKSDSKTYKNIVGSSLEDIGNKLDALNDAAKELGYDGIIFGADAASGTGHTAVNNINRDYVRIWNYTKEIGNVNALKTHINSEYNYSSSYQVFLWDLMILLGEMQPQK